MPSPANVVGPPTPAPAPAEDPLLARILAFELDEPDSARPFSQRLAEEQGWDEARTARAIREYKRFLFLAMTIEGGASPSQSVDAVWHLHLLYTRSYWSRLCGEVLGRPLHHEPSRGGPSERVKHAAMYARTLGAYRVAFGDEPPAEFWPQGPTLARRAHRLSRRATLSLQAILALLPFPARSAVVVFAATMPWLVLGCAGPLGPFDLRGPEFLGLYTALYAVAYVASHLMVPSAKLAEGARPLLLDDRYELAFLAGGERRMRDTAITALVAKRLLSVRRDGQWAQLERTKDAAPEGLPSVERILYERFPSGESLRPFDSRLTLQTTADAMRASLAERGLVLPEDGRLALQFRLVAPLLTLALAGIVKILVGVERDKPVAFLTMAVAVTLFTAAVRGSSVERRTELGRRSLDASVRAAHASRDELARDPITVPAFLALGVAIDGAVSVDLAKNDLTRELFLGASSDGGGGCGSSCGGGGCGGGGGGGCGGCGGD